ncbi:hypothetical protein GCM10010193_08590 [Kitasatospora atroaurantiaca]|uniref:Uncharacterized protein n=1 Tax=Kitasatospora atroaurantiaca TaxID=285545 RepID=A0A561ERT5_9ACTN|nr:hypothetical protein [Kitasatospora atroaurantiaca]TWE18316.1 hypothetical protein FB465_3382 [Kitasatospora atroaurantiaca]
MTFLQSKVECNDLIRVVITESPGSQLLRATVEEVYSARVFDVGPGAQIEFIGKPAHFGQVALDVGERALLFISRISGRWYEDSWAGDLPVEEIDGALYALYRHPYAAIRASEVVPAELRDSCRPHPDRSTTTCFDFAVMESYLKGLIATARSGG